MKSKTTSTNNKEWTIVKMKNKPMKKVILSSPMYSWYKPIEIETLEFCNQMARQFRDVERQHKDEGLFGTGLFADNSFSEQAGHVAMAYETVAQHIKDEIKLREKVQL